ncbi:MAG TPA: FAD:protein FMN transferase [Nitrospirae bacterium]|nr:FAD:protein FMN transferase [Nitrospirota bacterium]
MIILMKFILLLVVIFLLSCSDNSERLFKETRSAMYTVTSVTVTCKDEKVAKKAIDEVFEEFKRLENMLNYYSPHSEITLINKSAGIKPVRVSKETFEIIEKSLEASRLTEGGFDITLGPVIKLWDFKSKIIPSQESIKQALSYVDFNKIILDKKEQSIYLSKKGMEINLGGIIKGYSADRAIKILKERGLKGAIVSVGGDIQGFGLKADLTTWNVGIQNPGPLDSKDELIGTVSFSDKCISTSGDYEKYFILNDKRYHHIINPKTGMPSEGISSITIIAEEGAFCDALATGLFVLGPTKALNKMQQKGIEGMIITDKGVRLMTSWFEKNFKTIKNPNSAIELRT